MITGMRDNSCREQVVESLERLEGVLEVSVSLVRAQAIVTHDPGCTPSMLRRAVEAAGFGVASTPAGDVQEGS